MRLFLFLLLPLLLAPSCADDDLQPRRNETDLEALNRLVPITQTGAGTFGCLVNGELWIPEVDGASDVAADATTGTTNPNSMTIRLVKEPISDMRNQRMTIGTIFSLNEKIPMRSSSAFYDANEEANCVIIDIDSSMSNFIEVSFHDAELRTLSGEFSCTFQEPECETIIQVTHGRFDLKYRF